MTHSQPTSSTQASNFSLRMPPTLDEFVRRVRAYLRHSTSPMSTQQPFVPPRPMLRTNPNSSPLRSPSSPSTYYSVAARFLGNITKGTQRGYCISNRTRLHRSVFITNPKCITYQTASSSSVPHNSALLRETDVPSLSPSPPPFTPPTSPTSTP